MNNLKIIAEMFVKLVGDRFECLTEQQNKDAIIGLFLAMGVGVEDQLAFEAINDYVKSDMMELSKILASIAADAEEQLDGEDV